MKLADVLKRLDEALEYFTTGRIGEGVKRIKQLQKSIRAAVD